MLLYYVCICCFFESRFLQQNRDYRFFGCFTVAAAQLSSSGGNSTPTSPECESTIHTDLQTCFFSMAHTIHHFFLPTHTPEGEVRHKTFSKNTAPCMQLTTTSLSSPPTPSNRQHRVTCAVPPPSPRRTAAGQLRCPARCTPPPPV